MADRKNESFHHNTRFRNLVLKAIDNNTPLHELSEKVHGGVLRYRAGVDFNQKGKLGRYDYENNRFILSSRETTEQQNLKLQKHLDRYGRREDIERILAAKKQTPDFKHEMFMTRTGKQKVESDDQRINDIIMDLLLKRTYSPHKMFDPRRTDRVAPLRPDPTPGPLRPDPTPRGIADTQGLHDLSVYGWNELEQRSPGGRPTESNLLEVLEEIGSSPNYDVKTRVDLIRSLKEVMRSQDDEPSTEDIKTDFSVRPEDINTALAILQNKKLREERIGPLRPDPTPGPLPPHSTPISSGIYSRSEALRIANDLARTGGSRVDPSRFSEEDIETLGITKSGFLPKGAWKKWWTKEQERGFLPEDDTNLLDKIVNFISKEPENNNNNKLTRRKGSPFKKGGRVKRRTNKIMKQYAKGSSVRKPKRA